MMINFKAHTLSHRHVPTQWTKISCTLTCIVLLIKDLFLHQLASHLLLKSLNSSV